MTNQLELQFIIKAQNGSNSAKTELLKMHEGYIRQVAWRQFTKRPHSARAIDYEDVLQECRMGLLIAIGNFDTAKGVKLLTYASDWIEARANRCVHRLASSISPPWNEYKGTDFTITDAISHDALKLVDKSAIFPRSRLP